MAEVKPQLCISAFQKQFGCHAGNLAVRAKNFGTGGNGDNRGRKVLIW